MCPVVDIYELSECSQKGNLKKKKSEIILKKESVGTTANVCRDNEYIFETRRALEETIPAKITMLQSKTESVILTEENQRKPWFFSHV